MAVPFALSFVATVLVLYLPGTALLGMVGMRLEWAVSSAPLVSLSWLGILAVLFGCASIPCNPLTLAVAFGALCAVTGLASGLLGLRRFSLQPFFPGLVAATGAVGLAVGLVVFIRGIPGLDAVCQLNDSVFHLNRVQSMARSQVLSSLRAGLYLATEDAAINPLGSGGFYPSGWHAACALVVQLVGVEVPVVINVVNLVLAGVVFPVSMLPLLSKLFLGDDGILAFSPAVLPAFAVFPWGFLAFGPLYANLAGWATVPTAMWLFVHLVSSGIAPRERVTTLFVLLPCLAGSVLLQPNGLFLMAAFFIPYCTHGLWRRSNDVRVMGRGVGARHAAAAFLALCAALWMICYRLPFLQSTVQWTAWDGLTTSVWQAVAGLLTLSYTGSMFHFAQFTIQAFLIVAVVAGLLATIRTHEYRGCTYAFLFASMLFVVAAVGRGELRHVLTGFWYTDSVRLAAMSAIFAVPLACLGLRDVARALTPVVTEGAGWGELAYSRSAYLLVMGAFMVGSFALNFSVGGIGEVTTPFGLMRRNFGHEDYALYPLSAQERDFAERVESAIPEDSLVINDPYDGSLLLYGAEGLRCYYRALAGYGGPGESGVSELIRTRLDEVASDPAVRSAVKEIGAEYVLVLNDAERGELLRRYDLDTFSGISSIDDTTPGFEVVLAEGDMRLYRIVG